MESDKPGLKVRAESEFETLQPAERCGARTVTELMDRIERTALERYFAARDGRRRFDLQRQPST